MPRPDRIGDPDQPPGIVSESRDLPPADAAAERVKTFLREWGDGQIITDRAYRIEPPLYARDLEVLSRQPERVRELETENQRLRRGGETLGKIIDRQLKDVLEITDSHDLIGEDGDGDWEVVWDRLYAMKTERDTALAKVRQLEAENERLREEVRALVSEGRSMSDWTAHHAERADAARAELAQARADECDAIATYLEKVADLRDGPLADHLAMSDRTHALVARRRADAHRSNAVAELARRGELVGYAVVFVPPPNILVASPDYTTDLEKARRVASERNADAAYGQYVLAEVRALPTEAGDE